MDFLETAYQFLVQKGPLKKTENQGVVEFEAIQKRLEIFNQLKLLPGFSEIPQLLASRDFVGAANGSIYLPEKIRVYDSDHLNRLAYLHLLLIIKAGGYVQGAPEILDRNFYRMRINILPSLPEVSRKLDQYFPNFKHLQVELLDGLSVRYKDDSKLIAQYLLSRDSQESLPVEKTLKKIKSNTKTPDAFMALIPCSYWNSKQEEFAEALLSSQPRQQKSNGPETERKKKYSSLVEKVDLEKEKANPVTHSFEKLETLDEYQGGRRFDSGDDELHSHSEALDELNLSKMTTGGENAKSIFKSDEGMQKRRDIMPEQAPVSSECVYYPEWNYKKKQYQQKFCRLWVDQKNLQNMLPAPSNLSPEAKRKVSQWRGKINALMSRPVMKRRLLEGDEVDYDEFVREFSQLKARVTPDGRWYASKRPRVKDAAVLLLFDQSMSSDSWIKNVRVLDVILESINMTGAIFDGILNQVAIVGTYSETRHNCRFNLYKGFNDPWTKYYSLTPSIEPAGYTRLGPAFRHANSLLEQRKERDRILILLTDAKPTDLDGYEGSYGVQDIKLAGLEAEGKGIKTFALTIDQDAKLHYQKMFKHYSLLTDPQCMAEEIFKILLLLIKGS